MLRPKKIVSEHEDLPKNVANAVLFLSEESPSLPFMNACDRVLGLGLFSPFIVYTPSE